MCYLSQEKDIPQRVNTSFFFKTFPKDKLTHLNVWGILDSI